jgi:hypothetical protein
LVQWLRADGHGRARDDVHPAELFARAGHWMPDVFSQAGIRLDECHDVVLPDAQIIQAPARPRRQRAGQKWLEQLFAEAGIKLDDVVLPEPGKPLMEQQAPREGRRMQEAMELLDDDEPTARAHGLSLLIELRDPDLFQWCAMFLEDEGRDVQLAALRAMLHCEAADVSLVEPMAKAEDKRVRAAALAALVTFSGEAAAEWFRYGLSDSEPCVRLETASHLGKLSRSTHPGIFALALNDPNPVVARDARSAADEQKRKPHRVREHR